MKRILFFLFFLCAMLSIPSIMKRFTYGFKVAKLRIDFPIHPEWEVPPDPSINPILEQPYSFIGKGAQSYVFASQDGKYVIKLFRYDQPNDPQKIALLFNACKIAYDSLRDETGLVYIHLNPTPQNLPTLICTDAIGRKYCFPLDRFRFALQKRAKDFRTAIREAKLNPVEMQRRLDQFVALLRSRTSHHILNTDPNLSRNFGFLEDRAIEFDFGNYRPAPDLDEAFEIKRYTSKLRFWLKKEAPEWVGYLDQRVAE